MRVGRGPDPTSQQIEKVGGMGRRVRDAGQLENGWGVSDVVPW